MASGLLINGSDPETLGVEVYSLSGFVGAPEYEVIEETDLELGPIVIERRVSPRSIRVGVELTGLTPSALRATYDDLLGLILQEQPAGLVLSNTPTRELRASYVQNPANTVGALLLATRAIAELRMIAPDPYWRDTSTTTVSGITNTPIALPQGTGEIRPRVRVKGPATNPQIRLFDYTGSIISSLIFTGSLGASDYYTIDCMKRTVYKNTTGSFTTGTAAFVDLIGGSFFVLQPRHFRYATGQWPTASVTVGTLDVFYEKGWA